MRKYLSLLIASLLLFALGVNAGNYDFPMNVDYLYGIKASNPDNDRIQTLYNSWKASFYEEGTGSNSNMARIRYDEPSQTVSEGIGYGMLIFVYMENATNDTQDEFDKLWAYYKRWGRVNGYLMEWKVNGFSSVEEAGSATDGDLDVALAMLLAHKQWGSSGTVNYIAEAEALLDQIYGRQVDGSYLLKPGDHWNDEKNPCYFTTASIGLFDQAQSVEGFGQSNPWGSVYSASQTYLQNSQQNGLWPDWTSSSLYPTASGGTRGNYYWDACRTPWRVAWDYLWYGTAAAETMCGNTIDFLSSHSLLTSPGSVNSGYTLSGSTYGSGSGNSCFVGGFASAFMIDASYQSNLDTYYTFLKNRNESYGYYAPTLQLLYLLTLSGNTPNFYENIGPTAPRVLSAETNAAGDAIIITLNKEINTPSAGEAGNFMLNINSFDQTGGIVSISSPIATTIELSLAASVTIAPGDVISLSYTAGNITSVEDNMAMEDFADVSVQNRLAGNSTMLDDCEDGDNANSLGGAWYTYNDNDNGAESVIDPLTTVADPFEMTAGGANTSDYAAMIIYSLVQGTYEYEPFVGVGVTLSEEEGVAADFTGSTGISFFHKGDACAVELNFPENVTAAIPNYDTYTAPVEAHADWTLVELEWGDFSQAGWGDPYEMTLGEIYSIQWKITGAETSGDLWLDNILIQGLASQTGGANKVQLVAAITAANTLLDGAVAGTEPGNYPQSAITALSTAVTAAQAVAADPDVEQLDVDVATAALNAAIADFEDQQVPPPYTLIASCDNGNMTGFQTYWFSFNDEEPGGASVIDPLSSMTTPFTMTVGGANGTDSAAMVTYTLDQGTLLYDPFVGFGFNLSDPEAAYDLTGSTGISFWHKGDALNLYVGLETVADGDFHGAPIPASTDWTFVELPWSYFSQAGWGDPVDWDVSLITKFQWQIQTDDGTTGEVWIDEVQLDNIILDLGPIINTTALEAAIVDANTVLAGAVVGTMPGEYPQVAYADLEDAVAVAEAVLADATATQTEIDAATADLETAIITFEASVNPEQNIITTELEAGIVTAQAVLDAATVGVAPGEYPQAAYDDLEAAIVTAGDIVTDPLTQSQVDAGVVDLAAAVADFEASVNPDLDYSEIVVAITTAQAELDAATIGTAVGEYPQAAATALEAAIAVATSVQTSAMLQTELDAAVAELDAAVVDFLASEILPVPDYTIIADAESENMTGLLTYWFSYNDNANDGESVVVPLTDIDNPFVMTAGGANGTDNAAMIEYDLFGEVALGYNPFVGFGFDLTEDGAAYDLTGSTGITFWHKGDACNLFVRTSGVADADYHGAPISAHTSWTQITLEWTEFLQAGWGDPIDFAEADITGFQWQVQDADGTAGDVWIDEVQIDGIALTLPDAPLYTADLEATIAEATTILDAAVVGSNPGNYPLAAYNTFDAAISAASAVLIDANATQDDIDVANGELQAAIVTFQATVIPEDNIVVDELVAAVVAAQAVLDAADIGVAPGEYPQAAADDFSDAIFVAALIAESPSTQTQVDDAVLDLEAAIADFEASVNPDLVYTDIISAIEDAQAELDAATIGTAVGEYPQAAADELEAAIAEATSIQSSAISQSELDDAVANLDDAVVAFLASEIQPSLGYTIIADAEMDNMTSLLTYWFSYNDNANDGESVVIPLSDDDNPFVMTTGGANGTDNAAMIEYDLFGEVALGYNPFVGFGFDMVNDGSVYDLTGSTGITFWHKGDACNLFVNTAGVVDADYHGAPIAAHTSWTQVTIEWSEFLQAGWGDPVDFDLTDIIGFQWQVQGADGTAGDVWIDEVQIDGVELDLPVISEIDLTLLEAAIETADALFNAAVVGTAEGEYPQAAVDALENAIAEAEIVVNFADAQDQIDDAVVALDAAIATFEASVNGPSSNVSDLLLASNELAGVTEMNTVFYTYEDTDNGGASVIAPANGEPFLSTAGGANGTDSSAMISYSLDEGTLTYDPFVGFGFALNEDESAYDLSAYSGISFYHKGDACILELNQTENVVGSDPNYDAYSFAVEAHTDWTLVEISWSDFAQVGWGDSYTIDPANMYKLQWKVTGSTGTAGEVYIDEVIAMGNGVVTPEDPRAELFAAIDNALSLITGAQSSGDYQPEAIEWMELSLDIVEEFAEVDGLSQEEIDDLNLVVDTLITEFELYRLDAEPVDMNFYDFIDDLVREEFAASTEGDDYREDLMAALLLSNNISETSTQDEVNEAVTQLWDAYVAYTGLNTTPIETVESTVELTVGPNPFVSVIKIISEEEIESVTIVSVTGSVAKTVSVSATEVEIDTYDVASGSYSVVVKFTTGRTQSVKVIK